MSPGDRIRLFSSCHARDAKTSTIVWLTRGALGALHSLSPAGWSGCALIELDAPEIPGQLHLVPWESLELAPGHKTGAAP